jgi:hypothetical protein
MKNPIPETAPFFLNETAKAVMADCREAVDMAILADRIAKKKLEYNGARAWRDRMNGGAK